jgi:putative addiction module component (TIGR02574 family)
LTPNLLDNPRSPDILPSVPIIAEDVAMDEKLVQSLLKLPLRQRISLAGEIWDSLSDENIPTPLALRKKLRDRLASYRANPGEILTLEQFHAKSRQLLKSLERKRRRSA